MYGKGRLGVILGAGRPKTGKKEPIEDLRFIVVKISETGSIDHSPAEIFKIMDFFLDLISQTCDIIYRW